MELVIASLNSEKVREYRTMLKELMPDLLVRSLMEFHEFHPQDFSDLPFEECARKKALHAAYELQRPCLADESWLVVPSLGNNQESLNRKKLQKPGTKLPDTKQLLKDLKSKEDFERDATLECFLAFATPDQGLLKTASSRIEGSIAGKEKGSPSFDFTSLFMKHDYGKTLAELPPQVYLKISHRRKALEKILPAICSIAKG